jgi:hypothetical protein
MELAERSVAEPVSSKRREWYKAKTWYTVLYQPTIHAPDARHPSLECDMLHSGDGTQHNLLFVCR